MDLTLTGCGNAKDKIIEQIAAEQTQTEVPDETSAVEETTTEEATETEWMNVNKIDTKKFSN